MGEILVWYRYIGTYRTGSLYLTVEHKSVAQTVIEFELRNPDKIIESYLDENNRIMSIPWHLTI